MKIDKFDFNDWLFEVAEKIHQRPWCPGSDGWYYHVDGRTKWLTLAFEDTEGRYFDCNPRDKEELLGKIKTALKEHSVKEFYVSVTEVGKESYLVAIIKAEDIKKAEDMEEDPLPF